MNIIFIVAIVLLIVFLLKRKRLKLGNVVLISGGVKTGKSLMTLRFALKTYRKNLFAWWFKNLFKKNAKKSMKPLFYSNIPLSVIVYQPFTEEILLRKVRIPNKSVVFLDECSLVADSMLFKDQLINEQLMLFVKLFAHYTHGGSLFINTQSVNDLHYSFKRCIGNFIYISQKSNLFFMSKLTCRDMLFIEDTSTNVNNGDLEKDNSYNIYIPNFLFKLYDCYCFSALTDNLPYESDYKRKALKLKDSLKIKKIVSMRKWLSIGGSNEKNK